IPTPVINGAIAYGPLVSTYMRYNWVSSMSPCLSHYVFVARSTSSIDDINYYNVSTSSSTYTYLDLPLPSTNNTVYNFSVLTVDTGGRSSESIIRQIIFNVPGYVANLMLTQTDYPTDINDTVNITVSWNPPRDLPPIPDPLFYNIIYNVSGIPQNTTVPQHISSRTLSGFTVGSEYTVGVAAVNPLGTGLTTSATISISATPTMTPPTQEPSQLSAGAIAGIVIAIIVMIGGLLILGIAMVCYVKKKNKDKDSSVTPTPHQKVEAVNYAEVEHSAKSSSSKRQAPPKPASSHSHEAVEYSAIQNSAASHNPPPEGTEYADLDHSASTSSGHHQRPKDTSNQVQYAHMRPS
uniref:Fibronectin type-III domain-containing protein n=1 Tax=Amphimedon queenslandica TaxID=400682 RepID=A0A1X7ULN2_AMPQE